MVASPIAVSVPTSQASLTYWYVVAPKHAMFTSQEVQEPEKEAFLWFQECRCQHGMAETGDLQKHSRCYVQIGQFRQQEETWSASRQKISPASRQTHRVSIGKDNTTLGEAMIRNTVAGCTGSGDTVLIWRLSGTFAGCTSLGHWDWCGSAHDYCCWLHWSGDTRTGVVEIRNTVAGCTGLMWRQSGMLLLAALVWRHCDWCGTKSGTLWLIALVW